MKRRDDEKIIDILIGEAVLALLQDDGPVNSAALVAQLEQMAARAGDADSQRLVRRAIDDVREGISAARNHSGTASARRHEANSHSLLSVAGGSKSAKKH